MGTQRHVGTTDSSDEVGFKQVVLAAGERAEREPVH